MSESAPATSASTLFPGYGPIPAQPLLMWAEKTLMSRTPSLPRAAPAKPTGPDFADRETSSHRFGRLRGRKKLCGVGPTGSAGRRAPR
jgi:hypothetical protein